MRCVIKFATIPYNYKFIVHLNTSLQWQEFLHTRQGNDLVDRKETRKANDLDYTKQGTHLID